MSIGCGTGIPADVAILLLQRFVSFRELNLLRSSSVFVTFPLDYYHDPSGSMLGGSKRKTRDIC